METRIRVRFAPSPTGLLHVGNARTALFNFLFARKMGGTFILRLEDTDVERSTAEAEEAILEDLRWLGLDWDEGPNRPGSHGPYRQSERLEIYQQYAWQLLEKNSAYRCYCTGEELEEKRKRSLARGIPPKYDGRCRYLKPEEEHSLKAAGRPASVRFRVEARSIEFEDLVKGRVSFDGQGIGDFIILRSDGVSPYNFAVVVDDALMEITHVIRGEDHLTNTARQLLLYKALGFPPPKFAHLSMILGSDRTPLSKRHGATAVNHFREEGYLPEALANYLALLGWSSADGQEIFSREALIKRFSLERVSRSSAVFDLEKLKWVNRMHMKSLPRKKALELALPFLQKSKINVERKSERWLSAVLETVWGEMDTLSQLADRLKIFFDEGWGMEPEAERILAREENRRVVYGLQQELRAVEEVTSENYKQILASLGKRVGLSGRSLYMPLRAALTGKTRGPELEKIFILLGKERALKRAESALQRTR
ncbi:MAG: glutamate--tRNA ligase [Deltaproteobacteria bacterium]|nr:glutamate--tRNA ligase [Deltaproteobacteria bacterium]